MREYRGFSPFRVGTDPSAASGRASEVRCDRDRELKERWYAVDDALRRRAIYLCNEVVKRRATTMSRDGEAWYALDDAMRRRANFLCNEVERRRR